MAQGCKLDTDHDGNCPIHPRGCPPDEEPMYGGHIDRPGADRPDPDQRGWTSSHGLETPPKNLIAEDHQRQLAIGLDVGVDGGLAIVETQRDESGKLVLTGILKSTEPDLHGDVITPEALETAVAEHNERRVPRGFKLNYVSLVDRDKAPDGCYITDNDKVGESGNHIPPEAIDYTRTHQPVAQREVKPTKPSRAEHFNRLMSNVWPDNPMGQLGGADSFKEMLIVYINIEHMPEPLFADVLDRALALRPNDRDELRFNVITDAGPNQLPTNRIALGEAIANAGFDYTKDPPEVVIDALVARIKAFTDTYKLDTCAKGLHCQDQGCKLNHR